MIKVLKVKYYTEEGILMVEYNKGKVRYETGNIESLRKELETTHSCMVRFIYEYHESI